MTATHTDLPHAFDDNPAWTGFRKALAERGGALLFQQDYATGHACVTGRELRHYRVYDCQGSDVGSILVRGDGPNGFEIFQPVRGVNFDDILDQLDIGRVTQAADG